MVPRLSVPTDAIVLSARHAATTTSHHWYHRAAHESPPSPHRRCRVHILVWWGDRVRPTISQETCRTSQPSPLPTPSCFPHLPAAGDPRLQSALHVLPFSGTWDGRTSYYNTTSCGRPDTPVAEGSRSPSAVDVHAIPPPASRRCHRFTRFLIAHNTSCAKKTLHVLPSSGYMGWTNLILQYHILWSSRYACRRRFPPPFGGRRPCDPPTCQSQVP